MWDLVTLTGEILKRKTFANFGPFSRKLNTRKIENCSSSKIISRNSCHFSTKFLQYRRLFFQKLSKKKIQNFLHSRKFILQNFLYSSIRENLFKTFANFANFSSHDSFSKRMCKLNKVSKINAYERFETSNDFCLDRI